MFIPPWYQPPIVQPVSELIAKMPYMKLQYPTYVKYTDLNVHNKVFKKAIQTIGEIIKSNIINMFGFTFRDNIFEWGKTTFKTIQTVLLKNLSKHFVSDSKQ
jgi:hypothetical protein